uniref:Si:dkey-30c15.2 n=1 Tax=Amphilophus citrinellus TaxID=61819 RepID=A0A3Q0QNP8_AMPCI
MCTVLQVHLLVQLTLADLLAALVLMSTSVMNKVSINNSLIICQYGLPLSLTFYFISFLLVVVYAWKSKNAIQGWRERPADDEEGQVRRHDRQVAFGDYNLSRNCKDSLTCFSLSETIHDAFIRAFLFIVINILIISMFLPLVALFLILLSTLLVNTPVEQRSLFGFYMIQSCRLKYCFCVLQAASVSLQGFLNSMVYAWRRPNFTEAVLGESTPLVSHYHMPFFDESLRTPL